jgi:hypothetical protein
MSDFNFFEHTVDEKAEGQRKMSIILGRLGLLAVYAGCIGALLAIFALLAIIPIVLLPIFLAFWKWFKCDLKYVIEGGTMSFYRIHHGSRKPQPPKNLEVTIKDFREVAPLTAEAAAKIKADGYTKVYMFAPHSKADDLYYATFEQNGVKCVVYFQAVEKSLKLLKYYNSNTLVTAVSH